MSTIHHSIELQPFEVPTGVLTVAPTGKSHNGLSFRTPIPLRDLSPETLDALCSAFRSTVFAVANKADPRPTKAPYEIR